MDNLRKINDILVNLFNGVLKLEETALQESARNDLSITELHTLVAIGTGKGKTMTQAANLLKVKVSTLTAAVNKLVKKGYVERSRSSKDRRIVKIHLTEEGCMAVREHENFHMEMVADAVAGIPEDEVAKFAESLDSINRYLVQKKHPPIRGRGPLRLEPIKLGKQTVPVPIFQGALSIGLSMSPLAAAAAREGGVGVIASFEIGYDEEDYRDDPVKANVRALKREVRKALELVKDCENRGPIGVNVMWSANGCRQYTEAAVEAGAEVIICGAGIPTTLPSFCKDKKVALVPIISSRRAAALIIRNWAKKYNRTPDGFIFQGPQAGGYLGIKESQIEAAEEDFYKNISDIKTEIAELGECPLIVGGGLYCREDLERAFSYGADGFQIGTRFVTAKECSAGENFKNAYLNCTEKDIMMITNSLGFPGRVIASDYSRKIAEQPEKIPEGLINAARDNLTEGLVFCGGKVQKAHKIETVAEIFREFTGQPKSGGEKSD